MTKYNAAKVALFDYKSTIFKPSQPGPLFYNFFWVLRNFTQNILGDQIFLFSKKKSLETISTKSLCADFNELKAFFIAADTVFYITGCQALGKTSKT